jgi:multimeric flavodoxin WrbA
MQTVDIRSVPARILFINGSPDKQDRTEGLLQRAIEGARSLGNVDVQVYDFLGKEMYPCKGCVEYCLKNTRCVSKDSLHELIDEWLKADGVIWGMPVYSFGTPVQVRSFIDRFGEQIFQSRWQERLPWWRFAKPVGTILEGSDQHGGLEFEALGLFSHYILINAFHVPGDSLRSSSGVIGRYADGETLADQPQVLQEAYRLGVRVVETAKLLLTGKYALASSLPDVYWCSKEDYKRAARPVAD